MQDKNIQNINFENLIISAPIETLEVFVENIKNKFNTTNLDEIIEIIKLKQTEKKIKPLFE